MERELYQKIYIRSESDLPKEEGKYFVGLKLNGEHIDVYWWLNNVDKQFQNEYWLNTFDWYLRPLPRPERKTAEEMTEDEMDLIQYVTNLLYFARNETSEFANIEFDRWVEDQTTNLREYAAQGIASENTIPYIKSEHDHQLPRIAKIIGKDKFVFEQSINALLYIIETQGIDWPSEEESNKILDKKAFRVPYDGSDNFYDESFIKGWKACYEWFLKRLKK